MLFREGDQTNPGGRAVVIIGSRGDIYAPDPRTAEGWVRIVGVEGK